MKPAPPVTSTFTLATPVLFIEERGFLVGRFVESTDQRIDLNESAVAILGFEVLFGPRGSTSPIGSAAILRPFLQPNT